MHLRTWLWASTALIVLGGCSARADTPVAEVVEQLDPAAYRHYIEDVLYTHVGDNRGLDGAEHDRARQNIYDHFVSVGLPTSLHEFTYNGRVFYNVVAVKEGVLRPDDVFIVGAHYDTVSNPGVDDNGSGLAAIMEAARVLAGYPTEATIVFIAFDVEEPGLFGSAAYAADHGGQRIVGMLSIDSIGYRLPSEDRVRVVSSNSNTMQDQLAEAVTLYARGVVPLIDVDGGELSDHRSFEAITDACLFLAASDNPNMHTPDDALEVPGSIDFDYAFEITRAAVGYLATRAVLLGNGPGPDPDPGPPADTDLDDDGIVGILDVLILARSWNTTPVKANHNAACDFNRDGHVDVLDLMILVRQWST